MSTQSKTPEERKLIITLMFAGLALVVVGALAVFIIVYGQRDGTGSNTVAILAAVITPLATFGGVVIGAVMGQKTGAAGKEEVERRADLLQFQADYTQSQLGRFQTELGYQYKVLFDQAERGREDAAPAEVQEPKDADRSDEGTMQLAGAGRL